MDYKFRQIKFRLPDGRLEIVRDRIRTMGEITKWIDKRKPIDCYYSTSLWLDPLRLRGKGTPGYMGSDYVFDVDAHGRPLEEAAKDTKMMFGALDSLRKSVETVKGHHFEPVYRYLSNPASLAFTGRGFRIVIEGYRGIDLAEDARIRQSFLRYLQYTFNVNGFMMQLPFDLPVFLNPYGVIRILGTFNSKSGLPCMRISDDYLDDLSWVEFLPREKVEQPVKDRPPFWSFGLASSVRGTKGEHVLMFDFDEKALDWIVQRLTKISKVYNFGAVYVILRTSERRYSAISTTPVPAERMKKILKASRSHPAFTERFNLFRNVFVRTMPKFAIPGNHHIAPAPVPVEMVSIGTDRAWRESLGHRIFLEKFYGLDLDEVPSQTVGAPNVNYRRYSKNAPPDWDWGRVK